MTIEDKKVFNINRIAVLYRDLLSANMSKLNAKDTQLLFNIKPKNKIVAIGDIDLNNWNVYPLMYLLNNKLVAPTVLDESKIYQSIQAMRTHNTSILHPQTLISQSVVIRIVGLDNSSNINDYINSFINMCIASDVCKVIFVIIDGDKRFYKNNVYVRKTNSSFIDISSPDKKPYQVESTPLCISPDDVTFFGFTKKQKTTTITTSTTQRLLFDADETINAAQVKSKKLKKNNCASLLNDPDYF